MNFAHAQTKPAPRHLPTFLATSLQYITFSVTEDVKFDLSSYEIEGFDIQADTGSSLVFDCVEKNNEYFTSTRTNQFTSFLSMSYLGRSQLLVANLDQVKNHPTLDETYMEKPLAKMGVTKNKLFRVGAVRSELVHVPSCVVHPKHFQLFGKYASDIYIGGRTNDAIIFVAGYTDLYGSEPNEVFEADYVDLTLLTVSEAWLCGVKRFKGRVSSFSSLHVAKNADITSVVVDKYGEVLRDDCK